MKIVIFGLTVSSSWANGHATLWRGLCSAIARQGHEVKFFERDVPYYSQHRDLTSAQGYQLILYTSWEAIAREASQALRHADCGVVTSYCPDARAAADLILDSPVALRIFYDLDTPVTLDRLRVGQEVDYIPSYGLEPFDLVLSYTGGPALEELRTRLGAKRVAPLYGSVDPAVHQPAQPKPRYRADLSYLGTYAPDRQAKLHDLFIEPARRCPGKRFVMGGALYPMEFPWTENIWFVRHVPPPEHPAFYCSSDLTLSVTRAAMAAMGYCPSGRLFEAAACGTPVISDYWHGLEEFFEPGREILLGSGADEVQEALSLKPAELRKIGDAARRRVLSQHTANHRGTQLLSLLEVAA